MTSRWKQVAGVIMQMHDQSGHVQLLRIQKQIMHSMKLQFTLTQLLMSNMFWIRGTSKVNAELLANTRKMTLIDWYFQLFIKQKGLNGKRSF